jgi:hypothetical protein
MRHVGDAKERLNEAEVELIRTGSYGSIMIDWICWKAGVKKGRSASFFRSKADLAVDEGLPKQACIQNDPEVLRESVRGTFEVLGITEPRSASV